jgi:hypothetical protein
VPNCVLPLPSFDSPQVNGVLNIGHSSVAIDNKYSYVNSNGRFSAMALDRALDKYFLM